MFSNLFKKKEEVKKEEGPIVPLDLGAMIGSLKEGFYLAGEGRVNNNYLYERLGHVVKLIEVTSIVINSETKPVLKELLEEVIGICQTLTESDKVTDEVKEEMKNKAQEFVDMRDGLEVLKTTPPEAPVDEPGYLNAASETKTNVVDPEVLVAARMAEKDRQIEILMNTAQDLDMKNQDLEQRLIAANADASAVVNQARQSMTELRQELEASNRERERLTNVINSMTPTDFVDQQDGHAFNPD